MSALCARRISSGNQVIDTGFAKFGVLADDGVRIGAKAVIAPGAILASGIKVPRQTTIDQYPIA